MSFTNMPTPPVDVILGTFPRYYLMGETVLTASEVDKEPSGALAVTPAQIPSELNQEIPLSFQIKSKGVKFKNGIPYEDITAIKHTLESRAEYIQRIKRALFTDIVENGIPIATDPELKEIKYTFQKKQYTFLTEDLRMMDLLQYPSDIRNGLRPTGIPNLFNMAERPLYLPCKKNGEVQLFTAHHLCGTELFQEYVNMRVKYIETFNQLMQYIYDYQFDKDHTISVLWNVIYGHADFYGRVERVKISLN